MVPGSLSTKWVGWNGISWGAFGLESVGVCACVQGNYMSWSQDVGNPPGDQDSCLVLLRPLCRPLAFQGPRAKGAWLWGCS